jgi:microcystin-dependent protein
MPKTRRQYAGGGVASTLTGAIAAAGVTTFSIDSSTNWSTSTTIPFFVVLSPQTSSEEKMLVTLSSNTLTIVSRGVDGTSAASHSSGATIYPVFTALDADEANELTSTYTAQGDLVYQGSSTFTRLGLPGTAGHVLKANSGLTAPEWGQVGTTGIADTAVTLAKLATAVQNLLVPVGTISAYAGDAAPTGWLLCDGATSTSGYPTLAAMVGSTTPDLRGRVVAGRDNMGGTAASRMTAAVSGIDGTVKGAAGGNQNVQLHTHTQNAHSHLFRYNGSLAGGGYVYGDYALGSTTILVPPTGFGVADTNVTNTDGGNNPATAEASTATNQNYGTGTSQNVQPTIIFNYIIKHD